MTPQEVFAPALERETTELSHVIRRARRSGGLGVRVHHAEHDPYRNAAELCAELVVACDPAVAVG